MKLNYEEEIVIQPDALDIEWLEQAALAMKYSKHFAKCKTAVMRVEEKVKYVRSVLVDKVTRKPSLAGVEKATAPTIEAFYRTHKKYLKVKEVWMDAVEELTMAELAKNEISFTRKATLENLVRLNGQNYFAGPSVPRNLREEMKAQSKRSNKSISNKLKSRRNK